MYHILLASSVEKIGEPAAGDEPTILYHSEAIISTLDHSCTHITSIVLRCDTQEL